MLAELLRTEGVEEVCELRSRIGLMAFHGGSLEVVTDIVATEAAERAGASIYAIRQPRGFRWHIPSNAMDPADSAALQSFIEHVDCAIAVHGWGTDGWTQDATPSFAFEPNAFRFGSDGKDRPLLVGGLNRDLAGRVAACIRAALPHYEVVDDLDRIPPNVRGLDPRNLVNRVRGGGVQLELTPRVRGLPPFWEKEQRGRACPDTQALIDALASAVAAAS
jgi:phage replication-related protein YjqB (UPF0714/DUF867 family)